MEESHFVLIEFVGGVEGVADMGNVDHGRHILGGFIGFLDNRAYLRIGFCGSELFGEFAGFCFGSINIRADVFDSIKSKIFHFKTFPFDFKFISIILFQIIPEHQYQHNTVNRNLR